MHETAEWPAPGGTRPPPGSTCPNRVPPVPAKATRARSRRSSPALVASTSGEWEPWGGRSRCELALHSADVRNECQVARTLDRVRQLPLVARARSAQAARQDLPVVGDEAAERPIILVVDEVDPALAEGTRFLWTAHGLLLVVVVVLIAPRAGRGGELLFGELRCAKLTIVQRQEVADDAIVEPEGALVFRKRLRLGVVASDDVVTLLFASDGICELAATPMIDLQIGGLAQQ